MDKTRLCQTCKYKDCVLVPPIATKNADLLVIGEAPGAEEERSGLPFVGPSGQVLRRTLREVGFDMTKVAIANSVSCHPPKNETPKKNEIQLCSSQFLFKIIQDIQPKMIMCAGAVAKSVIEADMWQGIPVVHVAHPAALLYAPEKEAGFRVSIRKAYNALYPVEYDRTFIVVQDVQKLEELERWLEGKKKSGTDIETNDTLDPFDKNGRITHIAFGDSKKAYSIWLDKKGDPVFVEKAIALMKKVLADPELQHIFHRSWFDVKFLNSRGCEVNKFTDTRVKAFLVNENRGKDGYGLKDLCMEYIGPYKYTINSKDPMKNALYNAEDSWMTYRLNDILDQQMTPALHKVLDRIILPLIPVLNEMMLTGIKIDQVHAKKLKKTMEQEREQIYADLIKKYKVFRGINLNSPDQMQAVIFGAMKEKPVRETKTGYSVDEETLNTYAYAGKEWARMLVNMRKVEKLLSTYVDKMPKMVNYDGRIRTQFDPMGTVTGRKASSNPNLQNIPRNKEIYKMFVADKGKILIYFDFSQLELRTAASIAPDSRMLEAFRRGEDIHRQTATAVTNKKEITDEDRTEAKGVNFGLIYGQQAEGLKRYLFDKYDVDIELKESERIRKVFFNTYPGLPLWHKRVMNEIYNNFQVVYPTGRIRRFPQARAYDKIPSEIIRQGINSPNQGSADDCVSFTMSNVHRLIKKAKIPAKFCLTVHDSAMLEGDDDKAVIQDVRDITEMVIKEVVPKDEMFRWIKCPLEVDFKAGYSWGELEKIK